MEEYNEFHHGSQKPFPGNTVVEIPVPSGVLIASDDLRSVKHFDVETRLSINTGFGQDAWAKDLATHARTAYAFVGNTDPRIIKTADGSLQVVELAYDKEKKEPVLHDGEEIVARILTGVWATMLTDYSNWLYAGGPAVTEATPPSHEGGVTLISVTPGLYRWTVYGHSDSFDFEGPGRITHAMLELVQAY